MLLEIHKDGPSMTMVHKSSENEFNISDIHICDPNSDFQVVFTATGWLQKDKPVTLDVDAKYIRVRRSVTWVGRPDEIFLVKSQGNARYHLYMTISTVGKLFSFCGFEFVGDSVKMGSVFADRCLLSKWSLVDEFFCCSSHVEKAWYEDWLIVCSHLENAAKAIPAAETESECDAAVSTLKQMWKAKHDLMDAINNYSISDFEEEADPAFLEIVRAAT